MLYYTTLHNIRSHHTHIFLSGRLMKSLVFTIPYPCRSPSLRTNRIWKTSGFRGRRDSGSGLTRRVIGTVSFWVKMTAVLQTIVNLTVSVKRLDAHKEKIVFEEYVDAVKQAELRVVSGVLTEELLCIGRHLRRLRPRAVLH